MISVAQKRLKTMLPLLAMDIQLELLTLEKAVLP